MQTKQILIKDAGRRIYKVSLPADVVDGSRDGQSVLNYFHTILDELGKGKSFHKLDTIMSLPKNVLESYGINFEVVDIPYFLDLHQSWILPYVVPR